MIYLSIGWARFGISIAAVYLVSFVLTIIVFGIVLDPNGAKLLERSVTDVANIIWHGLYMCLPLAFRSFAVNHPVSMVMAAGYAAFALLGIFGVKHTIGRAIIYTLTCMLVVLGTVQFFLQA